MSADLLRELAGLGISTREAAKRIGLTFWSFRELRASHPEIKWPMSNAKRASLEAGRLHKRNLQRGKQP